MGRREYGTFQPAWRPPAYDVDEAGKVRGGYQPTGRHNWGRWGPDDQRGTANLITEREVLAAAGLVRRGRVFSLALPIDETAPRWPARPPVQHYFLMSGTDIVAGTPYNADFEGFVFTDDCIQMATQASTQWDGLAHVAYQDSFYNGFWSGGLTAARGAETVGIGEMRTSFVGRGVLIDLARAAGVAALERGYAVTAADLDEACRQQRLEVRAGDIVLLRTGYLGLWWGLTTDEERRDHFSGEPGPGVDALEWLAERDVAAVAIDNVGFEVMPSEDPAGAPMAVHVRALVDLGLTLGELWDLDELAADCAADGVSEFLLVAPPLHLPRAVGSPLNPIAIK
jgi:kynurenine formamidase